MGDVIFYLIFPIVIWNVSRDFLGDYYAMLISSIPGIIYSLIRFILLKKINLFGIFIISNLFLGTLIDVLSGSAINLLWNNIYYSYFLGILFLFTIFLNKPIALYFALDFVELQGQNRIKMKEIFYQKRILNIFKLITFVFAFRDILLASIKWWLISTYGIESFDKGLVLRQIFSWVLTGLSIYGFIYVSNIINENSSQHASNKISK
ncbi:VC0807 family protein [Bacillus sp. THAF10]|uniref:VC0807 family protein n=1 Tax=Bacillus sp. THAF10 TaxID=2587848 RepID=UPI0026573F0A|nr:VC0807 family protein [Bacillus sp. THAF10]